MPGFFVSGDPDMSRNDAEKQGKGARNAVVSDAADCSRDAPPVPFTAGPWRVVPPGHGHATEYLCVQIGEDDAYTTLELLPQDAQAIALLPDLVDALRTLHDLAEPSRHYRYEADSQAAFTQAAKLLNRLGM